MGLQEPQPEVLEETVGEARQEIVVCFVELGPAGQRGRDILHQLPLHGLMIGLLLRGRIGWRGISERTQMRGDAVDNRSTQSGAGETHAEVGCDCP